MSPAPAAQKVYVNIDAIVSQTDDFVIVRVSKTGRSEALRRDRVDFFPGAVMVPRWLADRIESKPEVEGASNG